VKLKTTKAHGTCCSASAALHRPKKGGHMAKPCLLRQRMAQLQGAKCRKIRTKKRLISMKQNSWFVLLTVLFLGLGIFVCDTEAATLKRQITSCGSITQPGLYTLTQNVAATGDCIVIQVDFVTVDLSSYVITGNGTGSGITVNAAHKGIVIRDGTITNFLNGIYLPACTNTLIERMQVIQTNGFGALTGSEANVKDSFFSHSGAGYAGLTVGEDSVVTGNIANSNGDTGIALGGGRSTAVGNVVRANSGTGIRV
jgi:hypothetical protein